MDLDRPSKCLFRTADGSAPSIRALARLWVEIEEEASFLRSSLATSLGAICCSLFQQ